MNKIGTTSWQQSKELFSKKLDDMSISDDTTTFINVDGCIIQLVKNQVYNT